MSDGWVKIGIFQEIYLVEMAISFLEEEGIICSILNKKDTSYIMIDEIELLVRNKNVMSAKYIIEKLKL